MNQGVILYGPPAAGKDTVNRALTGLDPRYVQFPRLKAGAGRTTGYRMTSHEAIDQARRAGDIVWENSRYDAVYVVDRSGLAERLAVHVPVVHLGQVEAITAVTEAFPDTGWTVVYLWCPRLVAAQRIQARATGDMAARLRAWDDTPPPPHPDLTIDTSQVSPIDAATEIRRLCDTAEIINR